MSSAISSSWRSNLDRSSDGYSNQCDNNKNVTIKSPLLFDMLKKLSQEEQRTVLDMGQACQSGIDFFNDYWCKLFITDAISELYSQDMVADDDSISWYQTLLKTIGFSHQKSSDLDMIFLWSLPNYLTSEHLGELIDYLLPYTSSQITIHAYIHNTLKMPAMPAKFHIKKDHSVNMYTSTNEQKSCPLYHLRDLENCFSPLRVDHSVMLSCGIQEYVFSKN